jgi:DNA-binding NarL/FixJ family response regulator
MRPVDGAPAIWGRAVESERLHDVIRDAAGGRPGAVFVRGEAGVGKTLLVRSVTCEARRTGVRVLWGSGLKFDTADALFLSMTMALDGWLREADNADRERVLKGVPGATALRPSLNEMLAAAPTRPVLVVESLLTRILDLGPTVLVLDDLQWVDPASRDCLTYLIAGFSRQRLAVVGTFRDDDVRGSDDFRTWVEDMRRMPSVSILALDRLDRQATADQLAYLFGSPPATRVVHQVFERSRGNAYLTELLVSDGDHLPPETLPAGLTDALLSTWHRLTTAARHATRVLAVAGRPVKVSEMRDVVVELGGKDVLSPTLHEALDAGILVLGTETVWFRHPLLAEVLLGTFLAGEAAPVHAAWARHLNGTRSAGIEEVRRHSLLARHYEAAGNPREAFAANLTIADLAEPLLLLDEAAGALSRAAALWSEGAPDPDDTTLLLALLERGGLMCNRADRGPEAQALVSRALAILDEDADPLRASRLLMDWADLQWEVGTRDEPPVDDVTRAVELARSAPDSSEYAEALSMLSNGLLWSGRPAEAAVHAGQAVAAAQRSGSARALSEALGARGSTCADPQLADTDTDQALRWARESGDDLRVGYAYSSRAHLLIRTGRRDELIILLRQMLTHALDHGRGAAESALLTGVLTSAGDLNGAAAVLREGLSLPSKATSTVQLRLHAATLASRRGDDVAAHLHRARAFEVMPSLQKRVGASWVPALAEVLLADSRPEAAFQLVFDGLPTATGDLLMSDEILLWGARAAAALVEARSDARDPHGVARARDGLDDLTAMRALIPAPPFEATCETDLVRPAMGALFRAERHRALKDAHQSAAWLRAASACARAGLHWEEHQALWRLGAALISRDGRSAEASHALMTAHRYALEQGAHPLRQQVENTAALVHLRLHKPMQPSPRDTRPAAFAQLTDREAEVLTHLVANRTNAEIASELFISVKTVSVHVSNLVRKTSTGSRREVAALALRLGWGATDPTPR